MIQALTVLWEAADRICGKRLKPAIPALVEAMERHGHLALAPEVRDSVLKVSAATIDRLLARHASRQGRRRNTINTPLRKSIAVRTFNDWNNPPPGFFEMDMVAHCGKSVAGSHVHSLVLTDIASGWTEASALVVREQTLITIKADEVRARLPFPMLGLDVDNDSAFINEALVNFCANRRIELTRSRAYKKNDQAWIEQKNGSVVRRLVGYGRLEGEGSAAVLDELLSEIRTLQHRLTQIEASNRSAAVDPPEQKPELEKFVAGLSIAWRTGEVRPTHRKPKDRTASVANSYGPL